MPFLRPLLLPFLQVNQDLREHNGVEAKGIHGIYLIKAHLQTTNELTQCMGNIMTQTHDLDEISLILGLSLELC